MGQSTKRMAQKPWNSLRRAEFHAVLRERLPVAIGHYEADSSRLTFDKLRPV